jgi:hypothetical protein
MVPGRRGRTLVPLASAPPPRVAWSPAGDRSRRRSGERDAYASGAAARSTERLALLTGCSHVLGANPTRGFPPMRPRSTRRILQS